MHIVQLSQALTDKFKLVTLGVNLGIKLHEINSYFTNNKEDITMVAYNILCSWIRNEENRHTAWCNLGKALLEIGLTSIATGTLNYTL